MRHTIVLALLLVSRAAFAAVEAVPSPIESDPMKATIHRLKNGLTVYLSPNSQEPRVTAWVAVRTGAKNDPSDSTGMAHYLEHMLFKGTTKLGTIDYEKEKVHLDAITKLYEELFGATDPKKREEIYAAIDTENIKASAYAVPNEMDKLYKTLGFDGVNAFTSVERTVYICNFPSNRAEVWARNEASRFQNPVFRLFQSEIETVYEEKNRSMDNSEWILQEAVERKLFKEHPYGQQTVLGSIEHLKNPSLKKMYEYFGAYYKPDNIAIVLSGDFDRNEMLSVIEKYFGDWKPAAPPAAKKWALPAPNGTERLEVRYQAEEKVTIGWLTGPSGGPDEETLMVMDMLMDNSQAGLLNLRLNQAQKVKASGSSPDFMNDAGAWYLWATTKKGQTPEDAEKLLMQTVAELKAGDFTDEDIKSIVTDFEINEKLKLESNDARVAYMTDSFIEDQPWKDAIGRLDRLRKVTRADVIRVANKYLTDNKVVAYRRDGKPEIPLIQKPKFTNISIDAKRKSAFYEELVKMPSKPIEPRWLQEGRDYEVKRAPWGKIYSAKNPMNDLFALTIEIERGWKHERNLCEALELLNFGGAGDLTPDQFKKKMYSYGSTMSISCGEQSSGVSLSGLEANFDKSLALMFQRFSAPVISSDTLKNRIEVKIGAHRDNKKEPSYVYSALAEYAKRGSESSVLNELSDAELQALELGKLQKLITDYFDYQRTALYVGLRKPEDVAGQLSAGREKFRVTPSRKPLKYVKSDKPRVLLVHRDMVQARVGLSATDTVVDPKAAVDYQFYNTYMGGMSGVFFQEVREARALAYTARGGYSEGGRKGDENIVWAFAGCQADKTPEAAALMVELVKNFPSQKERFSEAYESMDQNYRTDVITFRSAPSAILHWERLGLPSGDPRPKRFKQVKSYTLPDLEDFAKRFKNKDLTLYVLGPKEKLDEEQLKKLGTLEPKTLEQIFPY